MKNNNFKTPLIKFELNKKSENTKEINIIGVLRPSIQEKLFNLINSKKHFNRIEVNLLNSFSISSDILFFLNKMEKEHPNKIHIKIYDPILKRLILDLGNSIEFKYSFKKH